MTRRIVLLLVLFGGFMGFIAAATLQGASASPPLPCSETGSQLPPGLAHGNPQTGLEPAPGTFDYNYLFVSPTNQCPVTPQHVHLVGMIQVAQIVPAIGQPGRVPTSADSETIWFTFHSGTGSTGFSVTSNVTEGGGTVGNCNVPGKGTETCVTLRGTQWAAITYDGPDVFKGSYGDKQTIVGPNIVTLNEALQLQQ